MRRSRSRESFVDEKSPRPRSIYTHSSALGGLVAASLFLAVAAIPATASGVKDDLPTSRAVTTFPASPAGMFAECKDGTFSRNREFSKTCASGNGVKRWLAPKVRCRDGTIVALNKNTTCGKDGVDRTISDADAPQALAAISASTTSATTQPGATTTTTIPITTSIATATSIATTSTVVALPPAATASCAAAISNAHPTRNTTVDVSVTSNQPMNPVLVSVNYRTMTTQLSGMADGFGAAVIPISIGAATIGYTVTVVVTAGTARCSTSFSPL